MTSLLAATAATAATAAAAATTGPAGPAWPAQLLTTIVIVAALVLAVVLGIEAARDRSLALWGVGAILLLELLLVVVLVVALISWIGGTGPSEPVVFCFYLAAVLAIPPAMVWWGRGEPGRWGTGVVAAACLVLVVLVLRVVQVWTGGAPA